MDKPIEEENELKAQVTFEEMFVPGEMQDAILARHKLHMLNGLLITHLDRNDFVKYRETLQRILAAEQELWEMHTRRVYFDRGYRQGVVDSKKEAPEIASFLSHMAKAGQGLTLVQLQIGGQHHETR